ncbi:helix-turn-helix transcriptional regulator [Methylobacterium marchantiae]|uniref:Helix-turn-helix transcriptional regulator n=1 Tax=Methylobacterium marchantiae TaxID=600331 RepID=A0ABW3WX21_9HYPH|nr:HTH-type transcriptional activator RhaR [Methylobacterium marchantiae]
MTTDPSPRIIEATHEIVRADLSLDTIMTRSDYEDFEGAYESTDTLWIHLCMSGGGRLLRNSRTQKLDGLFMPGRVGLGAPYDGGEGFGPRMSLLALGISERRLKRLAAELPGGRLDIEALASTYHDDVLLTATLTAMWEEAGLHGFATAFFDHALAIVVHRLGHAAARPEPASVHGLTTRQMSAVVAFIDAGLGGDLCVADLARVAGLSQHYFSRCFQASVGLPPYAFITRRRLDRAADLLTHSTLPVASIAICVGYGDPSQFAAAFKRYKAMSPLAWRREQANG